MAVLFLVAHFVLFFIISLITNHKRLDKSLGFILVLSLLEGVSSYLIISTIFLYEFIAILWIYLLHLFLMVPAVVAVAYYYREINENWDWVLEGIKNNALIFLKFLLPFYVFMTAFQNQMIILQVLYSVLITLAIFLIANFIRNRVADKVSFFILNIKNSNRALLAVWFAVGIFCAYLLFFWHPDGTLAQWLSLANHNSFWDFLFEPAEYLENLHTDFPLYTQFGMLVYIPIIIGAIYPLTNYRKHISVIDINVAYGTQAIDRTDKDL